MKLLFLVVLLVSSPTSNTTQGQYTTSKLFKSDLDGVQEAMPETNAAGEDLKTSETKLSDLASKKDSIHQNEQGLELAVAIIVLAVLLAVCSGSSVVLAMFCVYSFNNNHCG